MENSLKDVAKPSSHAPTHVHGKHILSICPARHSGHEPALSSQGAYILTRREVYRNHGAGLDGRREHGKGPAWKTAPHTANGQGPGQPSLSWLLFLIQMGSAVRSLLSNSTPHPQHMACLRSCAHDCMLVEWRRLVLMVSACHCHQLDDICSQNSGGDPRVQGTQTQGAE